MNKLLLPLTFSVLIGEAPPWRKRIPLHGHLDLNNLRNNKQIRMTARL